MVQLPDYKCNVCLLWRPTHRWGVWLSQSLKVDSIPLSEWDWATPEVYIYIVHRYIYNTYIDIYIYIYIYAQVPYLPSRGNLHISLTLGLIFLLPWDISVGGQMHLSQAAAATKSSCSCAIASLRYGFPSCTNLWRQIFFQVVPPVRGSNKNTWNKAINTSVTVSLHKVTVRVWPSLCNCQWSILCDTSIVEGCSGHPRMGGTWNYPRTPNSSSSNSLRFPMFQYHCSVHQKVFRKEPPALLQIKFEIDPKKWWFSVQTFPFKSTDGCMWKIQQNSWNKLWNAQVTSPFYKANKESLQTATYNICIIRVYI